MAASADDPSKPPPKPLAAVNSADHLIRKFGLQFLNENGYIDSGKKQPIEDVDPGPGLHDKLEELNLHFPSAIHPIFAFERFQRVSRDEYDSLLVPVLRLATALLTDLSILPFFNALCNRKYERIVNEKAEKEFGHQLFRFGCDSSPMTEDEFKTTWIRLQEMASNITWHAETAALFSTPPSYMFTLPFDRFAAVKIRTGASHIFFNQAFLTHLRDGAHLQYLPDTEAFSPQDTRLRLRVWMATLLCHEIAHAARFARAEPHDDRPLDLRKTLPPEPFYRSDNICEVGYAFNQFACGDFMGPIGVFATTPAASTAPETRAPCGMYMRGFSSLIMRARGANRFVLDESGHESEYAKWAVETRWFGKMYTREFWEKTVAKDGAGAMVPRRGSAVVRIRRKPPKSGGGGKSVGGSGPAVVSGKGTAKSVSSSIVESKARGVFVLGRATSTLR